MRHGPRARKFVAGAGALALAVVASACVVGIAPLPFGGGGSPTNIPVGAQAGSFNVPLSCTLPILGATTFVVTISGVTGTSLGPNQQFYLTGGHGSLQVPQALTNLGVSIGATSAVATLSDLEIDASGATPTSINAAATPLTIVTPVATGTTSSVDIPASGTLTIGPFTAGPSGQVELSMGAAVASIQLQNAAGPIAGTLSVNCAAPSPAVPLADITIGGASGQPTQKFNITVPTPTMPVGFVQGSLNIPLTCTITGAGTVTLAAELTGSLPAEIPGAGPFYFQDTSGILEIPASLVTALVATGASQASGAITDLEIDATGATPTALNAAATPITINPVALTSGKGINLPLPQSGVLTVGPFTAGAAGGALALSLGTAAGTLQPLDASGNPIGSALVLTCAAPSPAVTLHKDNITPTTVPVVQAILPATGPVAGGTSVTLTGTGFTAALGVNFGNVPAQFSVGSDTSITVTAPPHPAGAVDITVVGANGVSVTQAVDHYTYS